LGTNKRKNPDRVPGAKYTSLAYGRAIRRAIQKAFALPPHLARRLLTPSGRKKAPRLETREEWWSRLTKEQRQEVQTWWKTYHWHPHQLRHSAATAIREQFGLDSAQALLGHANLSATQVYASLQTAKAIEVMRQVG
jgi:site-specific recombinase XerC